MLPNYLGGDNLVDVTKSGHQICGEKALKQAGLAIKDIKSFHPYDDFIVALILGAGPTSAVIIGWWLSRHQSGKDKDELNVRLDQAQKDLETVRRTAQNPEKEKRRNK